MSYRRSNSFSPINYEVFLKLIEEVKNLTVKGPQKTRFEQRRSRRPLSRHYLLKRVAKKVITPILRSLGLELRTTGVKDADTNT
jgi:hypothetical protein